MKRYINKWTNTMGWVNLEGKVKYGEIVIDIMLVASIAIQIIGIYLFAQAMKG